MTDKQFELASTIKTEIKQLKIDLNYYKQNEETFKHTSTKSMTAKNNGKWKGIIIGGVDISFTFDDFELLNKLKITEIEAKIAKLNEDFRSIKSTN